MACYRNGGCGPYEMYSCSECPASKSEYAQKQSTCSEKQQVRLIDANPLTSALRHYQYPYGVEFLVSTQPTIDPESLRPQGEWEFDSGVDYCYKCSECEAQRPPHYIYDNYCPNCGAKMKGGNDDESN